MGSIVEFKNRADLIVDKIDKMDLTTKEKLVLYAKELSKLEQSMKKPA